MDAHKNFAISTVATAPSPATSGTSLVVAAGQGALFPTPPFNATIWPTGVNALSTNAEIVRVTGIATDTLTITRAQESTAARTVVVGDQIAATITKYTFEDLLVNPDITTGFKIGGAAASRKIIVGNGTNFVPSTETWAVPGTSGNHLMSDGTDWTSAAPIVKSQAIEAYSLIGSTVVAEPPNGGFGMITQQNGFGDGSIRWTLVYLDRPRTIVGVKWWQGTQGNYTADNYNGVGLYSLSAGTLSLVASSTNDGNIWKAATNSMGSKAFSSTYPAAAGVYVVAACYNESAFVTHPSLGCSVTLQASNQPAMDFTNSVKLHAVTVSGAAALPSPTQAFSGLTNSQQTWWFGLYI